MTDENQNKGEPKKRACPNCHSTNVFTERRMNGNSTCIPCGYLAPTKVFDGLEAENKTKTKLEDYKFDTSTYVQIPSVKPKFKEFWITDNTDNSGFTVETEFNHIRHYGCCNVYHVIEARAVEYWKNKVTELEHEIECTFLNSETADKITEAQMNELRALLDSHKLDPREVMSRGLHECRMREVEKERDEAKRHLEAKHLDLLDVMKERDELRAEFETMKHPLNPWVKKSEYDSLRAKLDKAVQALHKYATGEAFYFTRKVCGEVDFDHSESERVATEALKEIEGE